MKKSVHCYQTHGKVLLSLQSLESTAQVAIVPSVVARSASYPISHFIPVTFFFR